MRSLGGEVSTGSDSDRVKHTAILVFATVVTRSLSLPVTDSVTSPL